jgi:hypothetical protein
MGLEVNVYKNKRNINKNSTEVIYNNPKSFDSS